MVRMLDFVVGAAGVAGFFLSLWLAVSQWWTAREAFRLSVIDYAVHGEVTLFLIVVENLSRSPLVVLSLTYLGTICEIEPKRVRGRPPEWNSAVSARFPIHIPPRDAGLFYIEFVGCPCSPLDVGTPVTLQIQTIRRTVPRTLILEHKAHYLNKRSRSR